MQQTPNTADLHTPQNTKGSQSSNPLVFGVFGNSLNSPLSIISKSGNLIKSSIRDGKGSEHILSVNKETCSQPLEYENFPLSDVTNVQQYKGKYPQRLYDSSFSRHTLTGQGHALITPSAKASIFLAKGEPSLCRRRSSIAVETIRESLPATLAVNGRRPPRASIADSRNRYAMGGRHRREENCRRRRAPAVTTTPA
nr:hypothetical protein Itr_chr06CG13200 [Ipomoea trifida]